MAHEVRNLVLIGLRHILKCLEGWGVWRSMATDFRTQARKQVRISNGWYCCVERESVNREDMDSEAEGGSKGGKEAN